ncbi:hypothetical protein N752_20820 [Desulforamulus aquiferis]|nr:hypothetical protein N752_20820 [Desulforamulus aquiferis]
MCPVDFELTIKNIFPVVNKFLALFPGRQTPVLLILANFPGHSGPGDLQLTGLLACLL